MENEFLTDIDGNTYKAVKIGNQIWMAENLNVSRFKNGDLIAEVKTNEEWEKAGDEGKPAWCYYDNDPSNGDKYRKLYNWHAVNDPRGLAPRGWHIPNDEKWDVLVEYLGGKDKAGEKMKTTNGWEDNGAGTNESGFSGYPDSYLNTEVVYWSSKDDGPNKAWGRCLYYRGDDVIRAYYEMSKSLSVRCIKD